MGIETHNGRKKHGIERAVVELRINAAQAVAQAMHTSQPLLKCHSALHRSTHHVQAGIAVLAVVGGTLDISPTTRQTIQGDAVCWWIKRRRHKGFHAMRNRIHASSSGQRRR